MTLPHIAVIIVNFNGEKLLKNCLSSLNKLNYPKTKLHITIVDNGSTDNSLQLIKSLSPNTAIIQNQNNLGFSKANNQALHKILKNQNIKYIWLLNNDTEVPQNSLNNAITYATQNPNIAALTGKILQLKYKNKIDSAGDFFHYPSYRVFNRGHNQIDHNQYHQPEECLSACAASTIYRAAALKKAKINSEYLDEDFISYIEDVDLSIRLRLLGYKIYYYPKFITYHLGSATSSRLNLSYKEYISRRNRLLFVLKNFPIPKAVFLFYKYTTPSFLGIKNHLSKQYKRANKQGIKHYQQKGVKFYLILLYRRYLIGENTLSILQIILIQLKASLASVLLVPKMLVKRRRIQKNSKINAVEIDRWFKMLITND